MFNMLTKTRAVAFRRPRIVSCFLTTPTYGWLGVIFFVFLYLSAYLYIFTSSIAMSACNHTVFSARSTIGVSCFFSSLMQYPNKCRFLASLCIHRNHRPWCHVSLRLFFSRGCENRHRRPTINVTLQSQILARLFFSHFSSFNFCLQLYAS